MTNTITQLPTAGLSSLSDRKNPATESTAELISSFKDIMSTMMISGGASSSSQSASGMTDMMTPLLMITLLEKLTALLVDDETAAQTISNEAPSGRPVGGVLTQDFHPGHNGLDFGIPVGTPVKATMDGRVTYAGWNDQGYGNLVIVENGSHRTYYAHLSSIPVSVGDVVSSGATIGLSGNTGNSTGPHLHYEIRSNGTPIDPTAATLGLPA